MITPKSRIRRILKHQEGYRSISGGEIEELIPEARLIEGEELVACYQNPCEDERNFMIFTNERLFVKKNELVSSFRFDDLASVVCPRKSENASDLVLKLKQGAEFKLVIPSNHTRLKPVFEFFRLFDRLIKDVSNPK